MLPFEDRYSRQRKLPEVGAARQAALGQVVLTVAASEGHSAELEALYLRRAGVGQVVASAQEQAMPFQHQAVFQHQGPRALAAGAWRALTQLRRELGLSAIAPK